VAGEEEIGAITKEAFSAVFSDFAGFTVFVLSERILEWLSSEVDDEIEVRLRIVENMGGF
jgi:hypothetical protein